MIGGGFAVAWHGYPRFTADIDFLIRPSAANAELIVKTLRDFGFASLRISIEDLSKSGQVVQRGAKPNRIDLITSLEGVSLEEVWANRVAGSIDEVPVTFIGREELIRNKECVGRLQDLADAQALRDRA